MKRRHFLQQSALGGALSFLPSCGKGTSDADPAGHDGGTGGLDGGALDTGEDVPVRQLLNGDWRFLRDETADSFAVDLDDSGWSEIVVPHTPRLESLPLVDGTASTAQWEGTCWYRRRIAVGSEARGRRVFLIFEGAMNVADVWLDGVHLGQHLGGYLPFGFDISDHVEPGRDHVLAVRLDNRHDPTTGPQPLALLDFNLYGGIYRDVRLLVKGRLYITHPILADKTGSGGVFVQFPRVSAAEAEVRVQTHVKNADVGERRFRVHSSLIDGAGDVVMAATSDEITLASDADIEVVQTMLVDSPALWSPRQPSLYALRTELLDRDRVVDEETTRVGIRRIEISTGRFSINGEPMYLRGTNRHQEYPYLGYAVSNAAHYRDAVKIKEAGFDFVRLSHYPHASAFLDACDELGMVVMDSIPGWQYFNAAPAFAEVQYENCRRMLRRDRNHPSVVLWEVSLNESEMPPDFISRAHQIAHAEYPGDQCFTCGWKDGYDVLLQARQHGGCQRVDRVPCEISEYGDWEYYAGNAGLNQTGWTDLLPEDKNSRQLRWHGERALLQQATNFQEAHNDNRQTLAFGDGLWVMFDYLRGYAPDIESSGCMDIFRVAKLSYYFFQSQRDPVETNERTRSGPMVFIASNWLPSSATTVRVISNCQEVELYLNGMLVERRLPDVDRISTMLRHPPFSFVLTAFAPGTLEAVGYLGGNEAARHVVRTPGPVRTLEVTIDSGPRPFAADGKDSVFVHAALKDESGSLSVDAWENVFFGVTGTAALLGLNPFSSDGGIASIVLDSASAGPGGSVYALALVKEGDLTRIVAGTAALTGEPAPFELRFTTDSAVPRTEWTTYSGPFAAEQVHAALFVDGVAVAEADSAAMRFRLRGSGPRV